ncbi:MAG: hypothetical protein AAGC95_17380 [Pseudomonadota bacterium]
MDGVAAFIELAGFPLTAFFLSMLTFVVSAAATRLVAMRLSIFALPDHRSSHTKPTPKTGGLAVVTVWIFAICVFYAWAGPGATGLAPDKFAVFMALIVGVCLVGLVDDILFMPALAKLGFQIAAASIFAFFIASVDLIAFPVVGVVSLHAVFGPAAPVFTVVWIVAFMNAFNFMDGLNGLAAGAGVFAAAAIAIVGAVAGSAFFVYAGMFLAPALLGFLVFNFPDGKIFLGDNGSQPVGFIFASLAALGAAQGEAGFAISFYVVPILFLPFILDVAITVGHRAVRRRNVLSAHNEHIYQVLNRSGYSHAGVSMMYYGMFAVTAVAGVLAQSIDPDARLFVPLALAPAFAGFGLFAYVTGWRCGVIRPDKVDVAAHALNGEGDAASASAESVSQPKAAE